MYLDALGFQINFCLHLNFFWACYCLLSIYLKNPNKGHWRKSFAEQQKQLVQNYPLKLFSTKEQKLIWSENDKQTIRHM